MSWNSLSNWMWPSKEVSLDLKNIYLKVEFLTQDEKVKKDIALHPLLQQAKNDPDTLIPYEEHYKCSHRFTFKAPQKSPLESYNTTIIVKQIVANIILSDNQETRNFYENNVNGIEFIMQNNENLSNNDHVSLYNENQIFIYDPASILEIIYIEKSFWERVKNKTKATIKKIPSFFGTLVEKLFSFILALLGLNGGITSLIWKSLPTSQIFSFITMIVTMFFPALGPILGLSKFIF